MTYYFLVMILAFVYCSFMIILASSIYEFNNKSILRSDKIRVNLLYIIQLILIIFWFIGFYVFKNIATSLLLTLISVVILIDIILTINKVNNYLSKHLIYYLIVYSIFTMIIYWVCLLLV